MSAYGLRMQYQKYGAGYFKKILLFKIPKLYLYLLIVNIIYYFVFEYPLMEDDFISGALRIFALDWMRRPNQDAWYLYTLIIMYALFAGVFSLDKFLKNKSISIIIMSIATLLYIPVLQIIAWQINYSSLWLYHRNIEMFALGILYVSYKKQIDAKLRQFWRPICVCLVFVCVLGLQYYCENVITLAFVVLTVIICMFVNIGNAAINFIGKTSLQIYVIQRMFIRVFSSAINNSNLYVIAVTVCTICL